MIEALANEVMEVLRRHGVKLESQYSLDDKHTISGFLNNTYVQISISLDAVDSYAQNLRMTMISDDRIDLFLTNLVKHVYSLCDGDRQAIDIINEVIVRGKQIYPNDGLKGLSTLQVIGKLGLCGDQIVILYSQFCHYNVTYFIALFRAVTMGYLHENDVYSYLYAALIGDVDEYATRNHLPNCDMIYASVKRGVVDFDVSATAAACV